MGKFKWHYPKKETRSKSEAPMCTVIMKTVDSKSGPRINGGFHFNPACMQEHLKDIKYVSPLMYECDEIEIKKGEQDRVLFLISKDRLQKNPNGEDITWYPLQEKGDLYCTPFFREFEFDKLSPDLPQHRSKWEVKSRVLSNGQRVLQIDFPPTIRNYTHIIASPESLKQKKEPELYFLNDN